MAKGGVGGGGGLSYFDAARALHKAVAPEDWGLGGWGREDMIFMQGKAGGWGG